MANVHVNLLFEANTQNAINNINQLGQLLNQISSKTTIGIESGSLNQAAQAARELQIHLGNAVNVNTGKLDLTKLNTSLKQSNQSLNQLSSSLVAAGTTGQQAFVKLANSIATAQAPAFALGTALKSMARTLGTAMMWSAAYGAVDALTQTFKGAIDYAKDLNKALNDIAIVSDLTATQLTQFAQSASKAAKELKTTTTEYAQAALIFYQQGLEGSAVKERTDAVIKMMHVTGQTAETVSNQMTAVWNNFYNGAESLEYYIDVLTALGAATASSTDEITQGLEKFAAIANTVGLSYEYAATALATVTAQTRQSADVVGTAFKTLFARIQDLELGETLEDGVTLGSYSQALAKIGVSALDANGNLREMDDILNDMGAKWDYLSKAQQTATAQSVAGVRQYTQLIALMDNWDTFKINLEVAENAEGTLEEQHETWAESAEAAGKRVSESWNQVYDSILDDDTVINFTNAFAEILDYIGQFIDGIGGIGPLLMAIVGIFSAKLIPLVITFGKNLVYNFQVAFGIAQKQSLQVQQNFKAMLNDMVKMGGLDAGLVRQLELSRELINMTAHIEKMKRGMVGIALQELELHEQLYKVLQDEAQQTIQKNSAAQENIKTARANLIQSTNRSSMRERAADYAVSQTQSEAYATREKYQTQSAAADERIRQAKAAYRGAIGPKEKAEAEDELKKANAHRKSIETKYQNSGAESTYNRSKGHHYRAVDKMRTEDLVIGKAKTDAIASASSDNAKLSQQALKHALGEGGLSADGTASADASIASLEKITQARLNYNNIAKETKAIETDLNNVTRDGISNAQMQAAQQLEQAKAQQAQLQEQVNKGPGKTDESKAAYEQAKASLTKLNGEISKYQTQLKGLTPEQRKNATALAQAGKAYIDLASKLGIADKETTEFIEHIRNGSATPEQLKAGLSKLGAAALDASGDLDTVGKEIAEMLREAMGDEELDEYIRSLERGDDAAQQMADALRRLREAGDKIPQTFTKAQLVGQGFTATVTVIGQMAMAWQSLQMAVQAWQNPDTSTFEKLMSTFMALTMIMPIVTGLFKQNSAVMTFATNISTHFATAKTAETGATVTSTVAKTAETVAVNANTASWLANPIFWIVAIIIAAVAAIALLVVGISALTAALEKDKRMEESSAQALEGLTSRYEEATAKAKEFKEAISNYDDGVKALEELDRGTEEYNERLKELNEQAQELIQKYNLLYGRDWKFEGGRIVLTEEGKSSTKYDQEVADATYALQAAQIVDNQIQEKKINNEAKTFGHYDSEGNYEFDAMVTVGDSIQLLKDMQEAMGAMPGEDDFIKAMQAAYPDIKLDLNANTKLRELFDSALKGSEKLKELALSTEEATRNIRAAFVEENYGQDFREAVTDDEGVTDEARYNQLTAAQTAILGQIDEEREDIQMGVEVSESQYKNNNAVKNLNSTTAKELKYNEIGNDEGLAKKYAEVILGASASDLENWTYEGGTNEAKKITFGAGDNQQTIENMSDDYMRKMLATYALQQDALKAFEEGEGGEKAEKAKNALISIQNSNIPTDVAGAIFDAVANKDLNNLNLTEYMKEMSPEDIEALQGKNTTELLKTLNLSEEDLKAIGYENAGQFAKAFQGELKNYNIDSYVEDLMTKGVKKATELGFDEEEFTKYREALAKTNKELADNPKLLNDVALANMRLNRGLESVASNWDEWQEGLAAGEGSYDAIMATEGLRDALGDMLNIDTSELDNSFITSAETMELMEAAAEGDADALERLRELMAQRIATEAGLDLSKPLEEGGQSLLEVINAINDEDLEIGATIDDSSFMTTLYNMLVAQNTTVEDMQKMFDALGWSPEMTTETIKITQEHIEQGYVTDSQGNRHKVTSSMAADSMVEFPVFKSMANGLPSMTYRGKAKNAVSKKKDKDSGSGREKKTYEDEIERYHEITAELEDLERQLDAIAEAKDRAFGPDKLAHMDQEIAKQRELADAQKRYLSEIEANLKSDASYILGYGAVLDEQGRIINYDELMKSKIDAYNSGKMSEEAYEQFVKDLEQYEETLGLLKDEQQEFINLQNTIIDLGLEKVEYEVEFKVSLEEDSLALVEFMMDNLTDSVADAADAIGYFGQQADSAFKNMDTYAQAVRDIFSIKDANGEAQFSEEQINALLSNDPDAIAAALEGETLTAAQIEALREYRDAMIDEYKNAQEASIGIIETLGDAFEDAQKPFADAAAEMEHLTSVTQAYVDVIELVGAERLGVDKKLLTAAAKTQTALAQQQLTNSKNQLEQSKQMLADYRVAYEQTLASGDAKVIEAAKEQLENMDATVKENEQAMLDDLSAALEAAASEFEKAMEEIASSFEDAMTGAYGSFAALEASFEQQKALADRYLDDYQKIYELSKLNRDIINSIDDNDSIRAKERLRDIQEEINKLQESNVEMTQYEVDELRAKYELRLAEIALEEAQNAKSQVRMARDSEGNWSYVYTADEEAVGTAEQNYEDKLYAYQELAQNRTDELLEQMISIPREFSEAIQEIYQDQTLNDEQRRLRIKETEEYYQEMYNFVVAQMRVVNADAAELYAQDWKRYSEMTGYKISLDSNWVDSFEETVVAQLTGYSSLAEAEQGFLSSSQQMLVGLSGAYATYQETTKATLDLALGDLEDFLGDESTEGSLAYYLKQAQEKAKEVADEAASIGTAHAEAFEKATTAAKEQLGNYQAQMTKWKEENSSLIKSINQVISAYANTKSAQDGIKGIEGALDGVRSMLRKVESAANDASNAMNKLGGNPPETAETSNKPTKITVFDEKSDPAINKLQGSQSISLSNISGYLTSGHAVKGKTLITLIMADGKQKTVWTNTSNLQYLSFAPYPSSSGLGKTPQELSDYILSSFDTGGYTGSWGSSGRLAMLHQKELVLNAEDTVNFLDAVNIVREIAQAIDLSAVAQAMQMGNLQAAQATSTAQTLEQQVSIHAEFPNATNHSEIEEAFRNLTLTASQFANRKN